MMKDYLTYTMMYEFGAVTPLCSFVYITVNGEDWGLYLAVEGIEDSFLERNYGSDYGELYKPDSMSFGGGRGNGKDFNMDDFMNDQQSSDDSEQQTTMPDMNNFDPSSMFGGNMPDMGNFDFSQIPEGTSGNMPDRDSVDSAQGDMPQGESDSESSDKSSFSGGFDFSNIMGGFGGFGMGSSDVKLQYVDDETSSYSNIWNNAKTDITKADQTRLIESLKKLSNGEDIESVVDIEAVIRYFVVHNYVCNGDSYTGSMIHNYYLYEENGQMAMLPWDYNLAYGTFQGGNGQSTVNTPIDAPVSGGAGEDRPMWSWILSDESYTELYHQYYEEFLNTVDIQAIIENAYNLIKSYVEKDPTAFYTYEEFEAGVETMREFCRLRSESISMQLANGETTSNMSYVDASGLTLSDMGSMGGSKGGFGGMPGRDSDKSGFGGRGSSDRDTTEESNEDAEASDDIRIQGTASSRPQSEMPEGFDLTQMPEGFDASQMPGGFGGEMPEGFDASQMPGGFGGEMPEGFDASQMPGGFGGAMPEGFDASQIPEDFGGMFPGWDSAGTESSDNEGSTDSTDSTEAANDTESTGNSNRPSRDNMQMSGGSWGSDWRGMGNTASNNTNWIWLAVSVLVLAAGLLIAKLYKY